MSLKPCTINLNIMFLRISGWLAAGYTTSENPA
jgi:hypothetical protein